jgi:hypothetical protein
MFVISCAASAFMLCVVAHMKCHVLFHKRRMRPYQTDGYYLDVCVFYAASMFWKLESDVYPEVPCRESSVPLAITRWCCARG